MFSNLHCQVSTNAESHTPVRALYDIISRTSKVIAHWFISKIISHDLFNHCTDACIKDNNVTLGTERKPIFLWQDKTCPSVDICPHCLKANLTKMLTKICIKDIKLILQVFFKLFENIFGARSFFIIVIIIIEAVPCVLEFVFVHANKPKIFMKQKGRNFSIKVKSIVLSGCSFI